MVIRAAQHPINFIHGCPGKCTVHVSVDNCLLYNNFHIKFLLFCKEIPNSFCTGLIIHQHRSHIFRPVFSQSQPSSQKQDLTQEPQQPAKPSTSTSFTHQPTRPITSQQHQTPKPTFSQLRQPTKPAISLPVQTDTSSSQPSQGTENKKGTTTSHLHYPWQAW